MRIMLLMKLIMHWVLSASSVTSSSFSVRIFLFPTNQLPLLSHYFTWTKTPKCFITLESRNMCREKIYITAWTMSNQINVTPTFWLYNRSTGHPTKLSCLFFKSFFKIFCGFSVVPMSKSGLRRFIWVTFISMDLAYFVVKAFFKKNNGKLLSLRKKRSWKGDEFRSDEFTEVSSLSKP